MSPDKYWAKIPLPSSEHSLWGDLDSKGQTWSQIQVDPDSLFPVRKSPMNRGWGNPFVSFRC